MHDHVLRGCKPEPLGDYLKALGVLRLIAEQKDKSAKGWWTPDGFSLRTELDENALLRFFTEEYRPSPIANPWNGAGGFYRREDKKTGERTKATAATKALSMVTSSSAPRLSPLRSALSVAQESVNSFRLLEAPKGDAKTALANRLRDRLSDDAIAWLDAVLVVDKESLGFPPVLGTGGTEGNLDFASNFYQRLADLMSFEDGSPPADAALNLRASLFGEPSMGMAKAAIGQFDPGGAGGGNAGPGFDGSSLVNPWDFVLILEGTLMMASATTRKMEQTSAGALVHPFSVRAVAADYASASRADEEGSRNELWLPLWQAPTSRSELFRLFGEGRADVGRHRAVHAVDFARAIGALGIDRGISEFTRFGFHQRNGKSYFATPLGRWAVKRNEHLDLIGGRLGAWIDRARGRSQGNHAPASWQRSVKALERAIFALARRGNPETVQDVLISLALVEAEMSLTPAGRKEIRPLPPLDRQWLIKADDRSHEHMLAVALATTTIRERLTWARWDLPPRRARGWAPEDDHRTVWNRAPLAAGLAAVVARTDIEVGMGNPPKTELRRAPCSSSLEAFLAGKVDDHRLDSLIRGYSLVSPAEASQIPRRGGSAPLRPSFAACLLVHAQRLPTESGADEVLHRTTGLVAALAAGKLGHATTLATRRLRAAGVPIAFERSLGPPRDARRICAALAFPLAGLERAALRAVRQPEDSPGSDESTCTRGD